MLIFVDLETTGLNPRGGDEWTDTGDTILEVAAIVTNDDLAEVARFHRVTSEARRHPLHQVDPFVRQMHVDNGLWNESILAVELPDGGSAHLMDVDDDFSRFIAEHCYGTVPIEGTVLEPKHGPQLAGNTVSFDRGFMEVHLPKSAALLHYRSLDVTALNETARRFWPEVHASRPRQATAAHRAMPDVEHSLWILRYYSNRLGPVVLDRAAPAGRVMAILGEDLSSASADEVTKRILDAVLGP